MSEPQQIQINLEPNSFYISGVFISPQDEEFKMQIISGHVAREYVLSPKHAKRVSMLLQKQIAEYEAKHGELVTELPTAPNQTQQKKIGFAVEEERKDK